MTASPPFPHIPARAHGITGLVLAGGGATRMRGEDKGLLALRGRSLVAHVLGRLAPQTDELLISANRNLEQYRGYGYAVLPDAPHAGEALGPLAGIREGLRAARHALLLVAPCDAPCVPADLGHRLAIGLRASGRACARARSGGQIHPVFMLVERRLAPELDRFLESGGRAVRDWQASIGVVDVDFEEADAYAFAPLNTPEALAVLDARSACAGG